jgi:hypothetical protein
MSNAALVHEEKRGEEKNAASRSAPDSKAASSSVEEYVKANPSL